MWGRVAMALEVRTRPWARAFSLQARELHASWSLWWEDLRSGYLLSVATEAASRHVSEARSRISAMVDDAQASVSERLQGLGVALSGPGAGPGAGHSAQQA